MREPHAFRYARVSTFVQANEGLSLEFQEESLESFYKMRLQHEFEDGGCYVDKSSASRKEFCQRPSGKALTERLQPGDALIFYRLDRAFRGMKDMVSMYDNWMNQGIRVFFISEGLEIQKDNIVSKLVLDILTGVAAFEAKLIGQRSLEGRLRSRAKGNPVRTVAPPMLDWKKKGWKWKKVWNLVVHPRELELCRELFLMHSAGMSYERIYWHCRKHGIMRPAKTATSTKPEMLARAKDREATVRYIQDCVWNYRVKIYLQRQGVEVFSRKFLDATARGETILAKWGVKPEKDVEAEIRSIREEK